jgi:hypothetical protein
MIRWVGSHISGIGKLTIKERRVSSLTTFEYCPFQPSKFLVVAAWLSEYLPQVGHKDVAISGYLAIAVRRTCISEDLLQGSFRTRQVLRIVGG